MLIKIAAVLVLLWIVCFAAHVAGSILYLLLIVALVLFVVDKLRTPPRA